MSDLDRLKTAQTKLRLILREEMDIDFSCAVVIGNEISVISNLEEEDSIALIQEAAQKINEMSPIKNTNHD